ncbi:MAG: hypothetical protein KF865_11045 [Bdellovibrionaceae bacterium]|nr:hypothetical protein [Pseudobdellovibrionaceae bacterium]
MSLRWILGLLLAMFAWLAGAPSAQAAVWIEKNSWSEAMEVRFGQWIAEQPVNLFVSGRWGGIATDCADAAYAMRIIFAYENALPVSFQGHSGQNLSNRSSQFDGAGEGVPRVRRFINFVSNSTNTRTLAADTYPIRINRQSVRPGTLFVHAAGGGDVPVTFRPGHVYYLTQVGANGIITYLSSTTPALVRPLAVRYGIEFAPFYRNSGYRAWKTPGASRPHYSEEQFSLAGWRERAFRDSALATAWTQAVLSRLSHRQASGNERLEAAAQNALSALRNRVALVNRAWRLYQSKYGGKGCMSAGDYDDYSTPTRDVKIQEELGKLRSLVQSMGGRGASAIYARYPLEIMPGYTVTLDQLWNTFMTETVLSVSEPEHSPEVRWGLSSQGRWPCPHRAKQYLGGDRINPY